jgi:hypothetical protein
MLHLFEANSDLATAPHHTHVAGNREPEPSTVTNLEDLLDFLKHWFASK